ncbi:SET and MYND domain-containing protein 4 [Asbolus verrucosus]|uniref:Protein-lysine N-methyltransferase SMYD4 n=1 Tax=Asbolus verrucosus TaxID=1661398 RepID=A0A482VL37_ASBVE|nr:SET and MYND domain-containing protein 4 [Asbolus verrucosus]
MCEKSGEDDENFAGIRRRLLRHLTANSDVTALSKRFGLLRENFERVDFVVDLLEDADVEIELRSDPKSDEVAAKLREQGNEMYKMKKVKEAWELYTKSISYAEEDGVNLALAYANRSAVLFEVNLHRQCLMDISRALENNYPEHLKPKLFVREKNSKNLEIEPFEDAHEPVPTVADKNPTIQSAAGCVRVEESEDAGRHVVASRDIEPGEILAVEKPFASLLVNELFSHCHECVSLCYNLIPCKSCTRALYCSDGCRERAFETYHKYECPILATLKHLEFDKLKLLPLKIAFLVKNQYDRMEDFENGDLYRSDRYNEIHNLITNSSKRSVPDLFERATAAALLFKLVKEHTSFFHDSDPHSRKMFKEILLLHMQTGPSNFHQITELTPKSKSVFEPEEVASGAFAFLSLLNHSCCPNVTRFCYGSTIVLRAIQSIRKGEQCLDNYGYHHALMPKTERQKYLKSQYYFDCACAACADDWPLYDALPGTDDVCIDETLLAQLSSADVGAAEAVLEGALSKLRDSEGSIPSKDFCQIQEVVKQCFAVFANKRRMF